MKNEEKKQVKLHLRHIFLVFLLIISAKTSSFALSFQMTGQALSETDKGTHGIDAADVDGDGDLDYIVGMGVASITNQYYNSIWKNNGNASFSSRQTLGFSEDQTYSVKAVDVDNDGDLDIIVGNRMTYDRVYINNGSGVFVDSGQTMGNGDDTVNIAPADLNHDGHVDFVACHLQQSEGMTVWFNNGNGTFFAHQQISYFNSMCRVIALIDLEGDGDLDIIEGSTSDSRVYTNDGNGNFSFSRLLSDGYQSVDQVLTGDLDGDGDQDYVINKSNNETGVWLNDGSGNFTSNGQSIEYLRPLASSLCDVDGDGDLDIVGVKRVTDGGMRVWLNNGNAQFSDSGFQESHIGWIPNTESLHCADLDSDGDVDLIEGNENSGSDPDSDKVWLNTTNQINNAPSLPVIVNEPNAFATTSLTSVVLEWQAGSDAETPNPNLLTYDIRIGTTSGGCDIYCGFFPSTGTSPYAAGGFGNNGYSRSFRIDLPAGTYFWSVRTVDTTFKRSAWSVEDTFSFYVDESIPPVITDNQNGDDTIRSQNNGTYNIDFTDTGNSHLDYFEVRACSTASNCGDISDWVATNISSDSYTTDWALPTPVWDSLVQGDNYISIRVFDNAGNSAEDGPLFYVVKDMVLPVQSNWLPATGTTITQSTATITLNTNETASCKVSLEDKDYSQMTVNCAGGGTTSHSCAITSLLDGSEIVYIACADTAGNSDSLITNQHLTYIVDTTAPDQSNWSPAKGSRFSTSTVSLGFNTNEIATCKWSLNDLAYVSMTDDCTGGDSTNHSCPADGLSEGTVNVYIACIDALGNADSVSTNEHVSYTVDQSPPLRSDWAPAMDANVPTAFTLLFNTDENANCNWDFSDLDFTGMNGACGGQGGKTHSCPLSSLPAGDLSVYVACEDDINNYDLAASNTHLSYSVDITSPSDISYVNDGTGADVGFSSSTTKLSANWSVSSDSESGIVDYWYSIGTTPGASNTLAWTSNGAATGTTKTGLTLSNGQIYYFSAKAKNGVGMFGNITTSNGQIVDGTAPVTADNWTDVYTASSPLNITLTSDDGAGSGIKETRFCVDNSNACAPATPGTTATVSCSEGIICTQYVRYYSFDNVGNTESVKSKRVRTDHTPPSSISYVYDGTGTDETFFASTTTISANWAASSDAQSGITRYWIGIGTTAGATDTLDWTDAGNVRAKTVSGLTLVDGQSYYFTVKAENGVGRMSATKNSNGQTLDSTMTEPVPAVNDGKENDIEYATSSTQLSANWPAAPPPASGIAKYLYAIGTTPGGTQVVNWTNNGLATSVTRTGLTLTNGQTYYFSVMAESGIGIRSEPVNSNGQTVDTLGPAAVTALTATPGILSIGLSWANPVDTDFTGTKIIRKTLGYPASPEDGTQICFETTGNTFLDNNVSVGTQYYYAAFAYDRAGNYSSAQSAEARAAAAPRPDDDIPPVKESWSPATGTIIATTDVTITFKTDENADCKWSLTDQAYESMAGDCTGDGGTSMICAATGLQEGSETVYIACRDLFGNADTADTNEHINYTISLFHPLNTITLEQGWNLVGASKQSSLFQTATVFGDVEKNICSYSNGIYNTLTDQTTVKFNIGNAYWIYSGIALGEIAVGGEIYSGTSRKADLFSGWNYFAVPFDQTITWDNSHASLSCGGFTATLPQIYYFDAETNDYAVVTPNIGTKIGPWAGYAINVEDDCSLTLSK